MFPHSNCVQPDMMMVMLMQLSIPIPTALAFFKETAAAKKV